MSSESVAYELGMRAKAIPRTNIGETFYAKDIADAKQLIIDLGADVDAYYFYAIDAPAKQCKCCDAVDYTLASDWIPTADDVCSDCYRNQQQKAE